MILHLLGTEYKNPQYLYDPGSNEASVILWLENLSRQNNNIHDPIHATLPWWNEIGINSFLADQIRGEEVVSRVSLQLLYTHLDEELQGPAPLYNTKNMPT